MILGINTDTRYKGKTVHIQTEDSGTSNPVLLTHVFIGGTIIASRKTEYGDALHREDLEEHVRGLMRKQHREAMQGLLAGDFDEALKGARSRARGNIPLARNKPAAKPAAKPAPKPAPKPAARPPATPPDPEGPRSLTAVGAVGPMLSGEETPAADTITVLNEGDVHFIEDEASGLRTAMGPTASLPGDAATDGRVHFPVALLDGRALDPVTLAYLLEDD
jgi:hypothetical protein